VLVSGEDVCVIDITRGEADVTGGLTSQGEGGIMALSSPIINVLIN